MASFNNSILTVQNDLVTLLQSFTDPLTDELVTNVAKTQSECGIGVDSNLPAIWVRRGRMINRDENATDLLRDLRQFQLICYIARVNNNEDADEVEFDNATAWIKAMHKYLAKNRDGLSAGVEIDVSQVRDSSDVSLFSKNSKRYAGVVFTVPVWMTYLVRD